MIDIQGNNQFAVMTADFAAVRTRLQDHPNWGAEILRRAGEFDWRVKAAGWYSRGYFGARVIDETPDSFVAWGITGNKHCLAYRVEKQTAGQIRITPLAYLEKRRRVGLALALLLLFVIPVLLSPLVWKLYEVFTLRASRVQLYNFARYVTE